MTEAPATKLSRTEEYLGAEEALLEVGAELKLADDRGLTPLMKASASGQLAICQLLAEAGADITRQATDGDTALHQAAQEKHVEVLRFLLEKGADPNVFGFKGSTAAMRGSAAGSLEVVGALVESGADLWLHSPNNGDTCLHFAAQNGHLDMCNFLLERLPNIAEVNSFGFEGSTPFMRAAVTGRLAIVWSLLAAGADPSAVGSSTLHAAVGGGNEKILELLLERKHGDVNGFDKKNLGPFMMAAAAGDLGRMRWLLAYISDPLAPHSNSALHLTAQKGPFPILAYLLKLPVPVDWTGFGAIPISGGMEDKNSAAFKHQKESEAQMKRHDECMEWLEFKFEPKIIYKGSKFVMQKWVNGG